MLSLTKRLIYQVFTAGLCLICFIISQGGCKSDKQNEKEETQNPYTASSDIAAGTANYRSRCAYCHGLDGTGGKGPDLTRGEFRHGSSDVDILRTIREGIPTSEMPRTYFPEKQGWQVVAFVKSLSQGASRLDIAGNPADGANIYDAAGCSKCHMVAGHGGRLGSDLIDVGALRSPEHVRTSILKPDDEVHRRYWSVEIVLRNDKVISGFRLNEDTYSIQVIDAEENLHSLWKKDIREINERKTSTMPSYEGTFSDRELDDLVAYLYSLRGKGGSF
jgi:putative heme-binding domain-containing protein